MGTVVFLGEPMVNHPDFATENRTDPYRLRGLEDL
jgi:hypothetical protein